MQTQMTAPQLASKLTVWSKRKFSYEQALQHAKAFLEGRLGEGLIKDYFQTLCPPTLTECHVPTCTNTTKDKYCEACTNMIPGSVVVSLLKELGDFLCTR